MKKLSGQKKQVLAQWNLQELALLVSEVLALESDRQGGNYTLDSLSRQFGTLAFKYGEVLKALPSQDVSEPELQVNVLN